MRLVFGISTLHNCCSVHALSLTPTQYLAQHSLHLSTSHITAAFTAYSSGSRAQGLTSCHRLITSSCVSAKPARPTQLPSAPPPGRRTSTSIRGTSASGMNAADSPSSTVPGGTPAPAATVSIAAAAASNAATEPTDARLQPGAQETAHSDLGPPYSQVIRSDFLGAALPPAADVSDAGAVATAAGAAAEDAAAAGAGVLPGGRRLYLVVLNYCLPAGLAHVWQLACFRICADGGCNRLHDELPLLVPPPPQERAQELAQAEAEAEMEAEAEAMSKANAALQQGQGDGLTTVKQYHHHSHCTGDASSSSSSGMNGTGSSHRATQVTHPAIPPTTASPAATAAASASCSEAPADILTALRLAHLPDLVLGDLDSLRPDIRQFYLQYGVPFMDLSYDQDTTDLTKAVQLIEQRFIATDPESDPDKHQIVVLGALGGRLDHTLANLNTLHLFPHLNITLWGDGNLVRLVRPGRALVLPDERFEGPTCGLIPLAGPVSASSCGLRWELHDTRMAVGGLISSSNMLAGGPVRVQADGPVLWSTEVRQEPRPDMGVFWERVRREAAAVAARGKLVQTSRS